MRRAMLISHGDPSVFVTRPISALFLLLTIALVAGFVVPTFGRNGKALPLAAAPQPDTGLVE